MAKTVTGVTADLANTYKATPAAGGTQKGPGKSGNVNSKEYLKDAQGYYNDAPLANGKAVPAKQATGDLSKGPSAGNVSKKGLSMSENGKAKFGPQDQKKKGSGPDFGNRVK